MTAAAEVGEDRRRRASREAVLAVLRRRGSASRLDLVAGTGLSRATVSSIVGELLEAGLLEHHDKPSSHHGTGRRPTLLRLNRKAGVALGIDFGKRHLRIALADLGRQVLAERRVELPFDHAATDGIERAAELLDELLLDSGIERRAIIGAGMGVPGPLSGPEGRLGSSTILPGWVGVPAARLVGERLGMPVRIDNDAALGALAEWTFGAGRGCRTFVYVKVSTGIGAGLVLDGRPFRGRGGTAGELGHTTVDPSGPSCRCGNRGCLEMLAGTQALLDTLRPSMGDLTVREMIDCALAGHAACRRVVEDAATTIGTALGTTCNLLNPERVVIGGDLAATGDMLLDPARAALLRSAIPSIGADVDLVAGVLGERAEVLGAVELALRTSDHGASPAVAA